MGFPVCRHEESGAGLLSAANQATPLPTKLREPIWLQLMDQIRKFDQTTLSSKSRRYETPVEFFDRLTTNSKDSKIYRVNFKTEKCLIQTGRFSGGRLEYIKELDIKKLNSENRPRALIIIAVSDSNGMYSLLEDQKKYFGSLALSYDLRVRRAKSVADAVNIQKQFLKEYGPADMIQFSGHGTSRSLIFEKDSTIDNNRINSHSIQLLQAVNYLKKNGVLLLHGCSNGSILSPTNLAEDFFKTNSDISVISPTIDVSKGDLRWNSKKQAPDFYWKQASSAQYILPSREIRQFHRKLFSVEEEYAKPDCFYNVNDEAGGWISFKELDDDLYQKACDFIYEYGCAVYSPQEYKNLLYLTHQLNQGEFHISNKEKINLFLEMCSIFSIEFIKSKIGVIRVDHCLSEEWEERKINTFQLRVSFETFKNGEIWSGEGVKLFDDSRYEGHFEKRLPHGAGKMVWPGEKVYEGEFYQGVLQGKGMLKLPDGSSYKGEFLNGLQHGLGKNIFVSGEEYFGEHRYGIPDGRGVFYLKEGLRFEGQLRDGVRHGFGVYTFPDGNYYAGQFQNDEMTGVGTYRRNDCTIIYQGEFKKFLYHGVGTLYNRDGSSYRGSFVNHKRHGYGVVSFIDGRRIEGWYENNVRHGMITIFFPDGSKRKGRYYKGERQGKWIKISPEGSHSR